jgi:hypothetical protein
LGFRVAASADRHGIFVSVAQFHRARRKCLLKLQPSLQRGDEGSILCLRDAIDFDDVAFSGQYFG